MFRRGKAKGFGDPDRNKYSCEWEWESLPKKPEELEALGGMVVMCSADEKPLVIYWPQRNVLSFNRNVLEPEEIYQFLLAWFEDQPPLQEVMRKEWKRRRW